MISQQMEQRFVQTFILPNRRERLLHELNHPKKRAQVFWHFAGNRELRPECLRPGSAGDLRSLPGCDTVLYIGNSHTGLLPLREALAFAARGDICVMFHPTGPSLWQGEDESRLLLP